MLRMPMCHTVAQGESIASIAEVYGHFADTIWEHPANAALKALREDPRVLLPGDRVSIPDLRQKSVAAETGRTHRFRRRGIPAVFSVRVVVDDQPLRDEPYVLEVDGHARGSGVTDASGGLQAFVPPGAVEGVLRLERRGFSFPLRFGTLDPSTEASGVRERLRNLGFAAATPEEVAASLRSLQRRFGLPETGEPDEATRRTIVRLHDGR